MTAATVPTPQRPASADTPAPAAANAAGAGALSTSAKITVGAAVLALLLAAMDATVMGTVLPTVLGDVGGATGGGYAWLVSGFMLAQVAATPLAGLACDRIGERALAAGAVTGFLAASAVAGLADRFGVLVAARCCHGLAAGAIVVTSYVMVGRAFGAERRAAAQGLLSMVWGVAAVLGPVAGAALTRGFGWRWVFFVNIPLCLAILAAVLLARPRKGAAAAGGGAAAASGARRGLPVGEYLLVTAAATLLLVGLQGGSLGLGVPGGVAAVLVAVLLLSAVRRCSGVLLPVQVLSWGPVGAAALATFGACVVMYATVTVLPVRLAATGSSTTVIAVVVCLSAMGWVVGSGVAGGLLAKVGYRLPMLVGAGSLLVSALLSATGFAVHAAGAFAGIGTGAVTATTLALIQDQFPAHQLGVATSANTMVRNLGSAAGVNGIAALSAALAAPAALAVPATGAGDRAFWALVAVAVLSVGLPALFAPTERTVRGSAAR